MSYLRSRGLRDAQSCQAVVRPETLEGCSYSKMGLQVGYVRALVLVPLEHFLYGTIIYLPLRIRSFRATNYPSSSIICFEAEELKFCESGFSEGR